MGLVIENRKDPFVSFPSVTVCPYAPAQKESDNLTEMYAAGMLERRRELLFSLRQNSLDEGGKHT